MDAGQRALFGIATWVLAAIGLFLMIDGGIQLINTQSIPAAALSPVADSVVTTMVQRDTVKGQPPKKSSGTVTTTSKYQSTGKHYPAFKPYSDDLIKAGYDNAYRLIYTGAFLLLLIAILPSIQTFSILNLFTATFRDSVDALKQANNDAEEKLAAKPIGKEAAHLLDLAPVAKAAVKGKWGGKSANNERLLSADIQQDPAFAGLYIVTLQVNSTNPANPLTGKVIFHLPDTFLNPNPRIFVMAGAATLKLRTRSAFIAGAEADNNMTRLELEVTLPGTDDKTV